MSFKVSNTFIGTSMEDICPKQLRCGNQIVLFKPFYNNTINCHMDNIETMILAHIRFNKLYIFDSVNQSPRLNLIEEKITDGDYDILCQEHESPEKSKVINSVMYNCGHTSSTKNEVYLLVEDKFYYIDSKESTPLSFYNIKEGKMNNQYIQEALMRIFNRNFDDQSRNIIPSEDAFYLNDNNIFHTLTAPLDNDNLLVFILHHKINTATMQWGLRKEIYLMGRNADVVKLNCDFDELYPKVAKHDDVVYSWTKREFDKKVFAAKYDINQFIEDGGKGLKEVKEAFKYCGWEFPSCIDKFYEPIYQIDNFIAYPSTVRGMPGDAICLIDGKKQHFYRSMKGEEMYDHYLIAVSLIDFNRRGHNGINPKDGELYLNGKLSINDDTKIVFKDYGGIVTQMGNSSKHYMNINGYYVEIGYLWDEEIKQIEDRRSVMEKLTS